MCDTFVKITSSKLIFGKNSDREPNEAQAIVRFPRQEPTEKKLQCTYIEIPQAALTYEVILSKPFQMWGAEMGANEHGLVIGNEAVFTKISFQKKNQGLTGMDMLRLALERCSSADAALELMIQLLADYGQDACGGYRNRRFFYHNSFLIADRHTAWVFETAGPHWVAKKIKGHYAISNGLTLDTDYDRISSHAEEYAIMRGWSKKGAPFSFAKAYSDWFYTRMSKCKVRRNYSTQAIQNNPALDALSAMQILRQHGDEPENHYDPSHGGTGNVCMHSTGPTNPSQTTGSMVFELPLDGSAPTLWMTGTSMPCLSVYLPFFFGGKTLLTPDWPQPGSKPDESLWWQAERLHRKIALNYARGRQLIVTDLQGMQEEWMQNVAGKISQGVKSQDLDDYSAQALKQYQNWLNDTWQKTEIQQLPVRSRASLYALFQYINDRKVDLRGVKK
ncbi:MAG: carcinine hydrolase/isopenicillin-N N-acyltransferase family protein [Haliscomenobacter sp.]|uniref:carcinine hydrolase/isopenicillin-N N-acyltransferase family protein n=1 Tax=Haliscomenobacter sp. TaxID=2717303 RepID=UPI0029A83C85|nr:carcinine hydrolase/isopenicillin-N N-acyltransferase family protein [Haliscomenobacter sp.]MDX2070279.1 carcinine hydrolase/isopenicillin-N N-acyltransferase family protein [Haliscomenobacter sp.]